MKYLVLDLVVPFCIAASMRLFVGDLWLSLIPTGVLVWLYIGALKKHSDDKVREAMEGLE